MKAHYYRAQASLELSSHESALSDALLAHELCVKNNDKSLPQVTALVLKCKRAAWEARQKRLPRRTGELEGIVMGLLEREREREVGGLEGVERGEVEGEWEGRMGLMREVFERAREGGERRKEVPSWAVDDISFEIMVDPVMVSPFLVGRVSGVWDW